MSLEDYSEIVNDRKLFKEYLQKQIQIHPELFPPNIVQGWSQNGYVTASKKQGIKLKRIKVLGDDEVWQIHPSSIMPYMTCETEEAQKILLLSNWAPCWALAKVFDKDEMFIYRLNNHFGRYNIVGTTVKDPEKIPKDLAADEKHAWISGEKVYGAVTVGKDCFLGASISPTASEKDLTGAYKQFKIEAQSVDPNYNPDTVNTDGWFATINAWMNLFVQIVIIQCFLHAILKIRDVATKATKLLYNEIVDKAWKVYQSRNKSTFSQRMRRLLEWAKKLEDSKLKEALLKLCAKTKSFTPSYEYANSLRTSNMIDRLINRTNRWLFMNKWWHGTIISADRGLRAFCLLSNFYPYCPITRKKYGGQSSAFERLNNFRYHDCWLQNLLIATSGQDVYIFQQKKL